MKKKILCLFGVMLLSMFISSNVYATEVFEADNNVTQKGDYSSTRFIAGNNVTSKANIDGISFIAGNEVRLEGKSSYGFVAGNNITINENIEKDIFVAGNNIIIGSDAIIGRDIYIAGNTITIDTNIKRDLRVGGELVDISGITIGGDAYIASEEIKLDNDTVVTGKLYYPEDAKVSGLKDAKVGSVKLMKSKDIETRDTETFKDKVMDFIISVAASFIVMIVLFYLIPNTKEKLEKVDLKVSSILKLVGIGLVVLIVVPIIALIGLFTGVLTPIALITICLYVIFIYLSSLLGYYIVGNVIISKTLEKGNSYLALFCGIIIVKLVKLIPVIGGLVSALLLFYGIGLIYKYIISIRKY